MKLTPWYPGDVKPVRKGVYQTKVVDLGTGYQFWNGKRWSVWDETENWALYLKKLSSCYQEPKWRGVSK